MPRIFGIVKIFLATLFENVKYSKISNFKQIFNRIFVLPQDDQKKKDLSKNNMLMLDALLELGLARLHSEAYMRVALICMAARLCFSFECRRVP